jgi:hypothetical protein
MHTLDPSVSKHSPLHCLGEISEPGYVITMGLTVFPLSRSRIVGPGLVKEGPILVRPSGPREKSWQI